MPEKSLTPEEQIEKLNEYIGRLQDWIEDRHGTVDIFDEDPR